MLDGEAIKAKVSKLMVVDTDEGEDWYLRRLLGGTVRDGGELDSVGTG